MIAKTKSISKKYSSLESYVNWLRPLDDKNPRAYARKAIFESLGKIEATTETYGAFRELFEKGAQANYINVKLGKDKFSVIQIFDGKNKPLAAKYHGKIYPEGYVELPDSLGIIKLADFYEAIKSGEFEFGKSYKHPEKWLKKFTQKLINTKRQDVTTSFKQDLEDNLINSYTIPAGAVGKDFGRFLWHLQKWKKELFTTLTSAYVSRHGSLEAGLAGPLWDTLENRVSTIIEKEKKEVVTETTSLAERISSFAKEICRVQAKPAKALVATTMMVLASIFGAIYKDIEHASAKNPDKDTSSRQNDYSEPIQLTDDTAKRPANPVIYESVVAWGEDDAIVVNDAGADKVFGNSDDIIKKIPCTEPDQIDFYGDNIVWNGEDNNLYLLNTATLKNTKIASNSHSASIYEDTVVYVNDYNIMQYNLKTKETTILIEGTSTEPKIWKDKVVFNGGYTYGGLCLYDVPTGKITKISSDRSNSLMPDIFEDKVVWQSYDFESERFVINFKNVDSGKEKTLEGERPHIHDNLILYKALGLDGELALFNLEDNKHEQIPKVSSEDASIWEGNIVWREWMEEPDFNNSYIFLSGSNQQPVDTWQNGDFLIHATDTHVWQENNRLDDFVKHVNNLEEKPKFVLVTGDLVDWGAGESGKANFEKFIRTMDKLDVDWYVVPGNHDCRYGAGSSSSPVPLEGDSFANYYTHIPAEHDLTDKLLDSGAVVVFGLNSGWDEYNLDTSPFPPEGSGFSTEQMMSLEEKLDLLDGVKDGKDRSGKKKIIMMHHPTHWQDDKGRDDGIPLHKREAFIKMCDDYGVTLVLAGHTHEGAVRDDGTKWVVTGAAGSSAVFRMITYSNNDLIVREQQVFEKTLTGEVDCPAKLTMHDSSGKEINEFYSGWETADNDRTETVSAYGHDYYFVVEGTDNGKVQFSMSKDGKTTFVTEPLKISKGQRIKFDPKRDDVVISVDNDGNGKPESAFVVSDGELTADEWKKEADSPKEKEFGPGCYITGATVILAGPLASIYGLYKQKKRREENKEEYVPDNSEDEELELIELSDSIEEEE